MPYMNQLTAFGGTFLTTLPIFAIVTNSYTIELRSSLKVGYYAESRQDHIRAYPKNYLLSPSLLFLRFTQGQV